MAQKRIKMQAFDFEDIYVSYISRLRMFALEYVHSEEKAEDIVQDVFMHLWEKKDTLPYDINIISYLFVSTKNLCLNFLRHQVTVQEAAQHLKEDIRHELELKLSSLELLDSSIFSEPNLEDIVTEAIASLPEKCREIFIQSKLQGKKQKEIASEMNLSIKTIEAQMSIAHKKIKEKLKGYF